MVYAIIVCLHSARQGCGEAKAHVVPLLGSRGAVCAFFLCGAGVGTHGCPYPEEPGRALDHILVEHVAQSHTRRSMERMTRGSARRREG